jgi:hypothetical protein
MQHGLERAAWRWNTVQQVLGHSAWTFTYRMDVDIQRGHELEHERGHAA